ncbi:MAG TPA: RNase adapter RapZ [Kiloniellales bacterium]|nr:RNase adapter RapZ [Kiloniellales bacterium]
MTELTMERLHGTCVALPTPWGPLGLLLRGDPGAGKSGLALRLIDEGGWLVADDQVEIVRAGDRLTARPPAVLEGMMEVRGFGLVEVANLPEAPLGFAVDLTSAAAMERLPEARKLTLLELELPLLALDPEAATTPATLRLAARSRAAALRPLLPEPPDRHDTQEPAPPLLLVTGLSGAGRSTALKSLEDLGWESIDNLPLTLLDGVLGANPQRQPLAVGIDTRTLDFSVQLFKRQAERLRADPRVHFSLLFLDCDDRVLQQRYTATRRRHPLALNRPLAEGIAAERSLLEPLRLIADRVLDTTDLPPVELQRLLAAELRLDQSSGMQIFITSFSYRFGLPREADLVFDMRFLDNPHWEQELRGLTGRDAPVTEYLAADASYEPFLKGLFGLLEPLLERYQAAGKSYLTIALGCTGGQHRSVAVAERLAAWLRGKGWPLGLTHRELERTAVNSSAHRADLRARPGD